LYSSSLDQAYMHPAYQQIIGIGPAAIPLILRELEQQSDHWFWALFALTGETPAEGTETVDEARAAWLSWGRERGYI